MVTWGIGRFRIWYLMAAVMIIPLYVSACQGNPFSTANSIDNKSDWTAYTDANTVNGVVIKGNDVWAATEGGAVDWNMATGT